MNKLFILGCLPGHTFQPVDRERLLL